MIDEDLCNYPPHMLEELKRTANPLLVHLLTKSATDRYTTNDFRKAGAYRNYSSPQIPPSAQLLIDCVEARGPQDRQTLTELLAANEFVGHLMPVQQAVRLLGLGTLAGRLPRAQLLRALPTIKIGNRPLVYGPALMAGLFDFARFTYWGRHLQTYLITYVSSITRALTDSIFQFFARAESELYRTTIDSLTHYPIKELLSWKKDSHNT